MSSCLEVVLGHWGIIFLRLRSWKSAKRNLNLLGIIPCFAPHGPPPVNLCEDLMGQQENLSFPEDKVGGRLEQLYTAGAQVLAQRCHRDPLLTPKSAARGVSRQKYPVGREQLGVHQPLFLHLGNLSICHRPTGAGETPRARLGGVAAFLYSHLFPLPPISSPLGRGFRKPAGAGQGG